jgi:hypothetical protein
MDNTLSISTQKINQEKISAIDELMQRSLKYRKSDEFLKFFNFIRKFDHYSYYNNMLVYLQNENVTFFGGTSYWKKKWDRTVKQDAKAYIILSPMGPTMLVYDVKETEGVLTPDEFMKKGLGKKPFEVTGYLPDKIWKRTINATLKYKIRIVYKPLSYFKGGHVTTICKGGDIEICLKEDATTTEKFPVLIHELAHLLLGHTGHKVLMHPNEKKSIKLPERLCPKPTMELEAETLSYLVCHRLGLETQAAEYIAGYFSGEDVINKFSYEMVIKAADWIESRFYVRERLYI